jgi:hypothetical protein
MHYRGLLRVVRHTVAKRQILSAGRRSDRVRLHETECVERFRQRRGWKQASHDRVPAQLVDSQQPIEARELIG